MGASWFYVCGSEKRGPVDGFEIERLLRSGEIDRDTLAWRQGMSEWALLRDIEEFKGPVAVTPPPLPAPGSNVGRRPAAPGSNQHRRWVRLWARVIDYIVATTIFGTSTFLLGSRVHAALLFAMLVTLTWIPIEAWTLSRWSATPGKLLLRVRVRRDGHPPSFADAIRRSFAVWWSGVGLGSPLALVTAPVQAYKLGATGSTGYDRKLGFDVRHERVGPLRTTVVAILIPVALFLVASLRGVWVF